MWSWPELGQYSVVLKRFRVENDSWLLFDCRDGLYCEEQRRCLLQGDLKTIQTHSTSCLDSIEAILKREGKNQETVSELTLIHDLLNGAGIETEGVVNSGHSHKLIRLQQQLTIQVKQLKTRVLLVLLNYDQEKEKKSSGIKIFTWLIDNWLPICIWREYWAIPTLLYSDLLATNWFVTE